MIAGLATLLDLTAAGLAGFILVFVRVGSVMALLPVLTRDRMGGDASAYGLMLGLFGAGAICGAFSAAFIRRSA